MQLQRVVQLHLVQQNHVQLLRAVLLRLIPLLHLVLLRLMLLRLFTILAEVQVHLEVQLRRLQRVLHLLLRPRIPLTLLVTLL